MKKNMLKITASLALLLVLGSQLMVADASPININGFSGTIESGAGCHSITTGHGCFNSGLTTRNVSGVSINFLFATHSNPTYQHRATASNPNDRHQTAWRSAQNTGNARAEVVAMTFGNSTFWNIK